MNSTFKLALGLAAIDGLTSAFVAMLLLALTLIGSGEGAPAVSISETAVLFVRKSLPVNNAPMHVNLQLAVYMEGVRSPSMNQSSRPEVSSVSNTESLTEGGAVEWRDCESEASSCMAQLQISKPKQNKCWILALRAATTRESYSDLLPKNILLQPIMFAGGKEAKLKTDNGAISVGNGSWLRLKIDFRGEPIMQVTAETTCPDWKK